MNIMNKLTLRLLWENKRRTLVTIIGVIISVAMLTAVATIAVSFFDLLKRQEIAQTGEWHVRYHDVDEEQIEKIGQDESTKSMMLTKEIGYAELTESSNWLKPYVFLEAYDEVGFTQFPVHVVEGRLPEKENELIISEAVLQHENTTWEIGDDVTFEIGKRVPTDKALGSSLDQRYSMRSENDDGTPGEELDIEEERTFTIVGIMEAPSWERAYAPGFTILTYLDEATLATTTGVDASVVWHDVDQSQVDAANSLSEKMTGQAPSFNRGLLRYYGIFSDSMKATLYSFVSIIMLVIVIGSVSLIYNAFAISVSERSRHLGMLASIGATKAQKRMSVFFEGAIIGIISIPLGIMAGLGGIGVTFMFINPLIKDALGVGETLHVIVTPMSLIVTCLVAILTIFISAFIPALRASRITAIDAIRQTQDVTLRRGKVKTNRFVRKIFGIEAEFGLKNLKRNRRRYQITVFSLVISIILFLSVAYFTKSLQQSFALTTDGENYDIVIYKSNQTDEQWERLVDGINQFEEVTDLSVHRYIHFQSIFDKEDIPDIAFNEYSSAEEINDDEVSGYVTFIGLDDEQLEKFSNKIRVNSDELFREDEFNAILINDIVLYENNKYIEEISLFKNAGDTIDIYDVTSTGDESFFVETLTIIEETKERPLGVSRLENWRVLFIVSNDTLHKLSELNNQEIHADLYVTSNDPIKTDENIESIREVALSQYNAAMSYEEDRQMILLLSVFVYGFITLITGISIANIFNTISTSIALRRREFAMLKSIGMTPRGFNKMINYESIFYGLKSLLYGLPISIGIMWLMHRALGDSFSFAFHLPWLHIIIVIIAIFGIVGSAMLYSSSKVKKENIIDTLKQENI